MGFTLGKFKELTANLPDETPIAVLLSDGNIDNAINMWLCGPGQEIDTDDGKLTIVVVPN